MSTPYLLMVISMWEVLKICHEDFQNIEWIFQRKEEDAGFLHSLYEEFSKDAFFIMLL